MLLGDASRRIIISSFLDFDFRSLGGHFVTDHIFAFLRICSVPARVWSALYTVCGRYTRNHLGVLGPVRSTPAARPWRGCGTPHPENCPSRTWPRHGRGTAPEKTVVHRPFLVGRVIKWWLSDTRSKSRASRGKYGCDTVLEKGRCEIMLEE